MGDLMTQMLLSFANNNPQIREILKEINESGMSAEELFYKKAKEKGVDPDSILNQLK